MNNRFKLFWYYSRIMENSEGLLNKLWRILKEIILSGYYLTSFGANKKCETLFFTSISRKDHVDLFSKIYGTCGKVKSIIQVNHVRRISAKTLYFALLNKRIFCETKNVMVPDIGGDNNLLQTKLETIPFLDRVLMFVKYCKILCIVTKICNNEFYGATQLVVLCDALVIENVLIVAAQKRGIHVVCCQHGLYTDNLAERSYDSLNYYDLPSDDYLVWGETTKKLFLKYNNNLRVHICGNPSLSIDPNIDQTRNLWCIILDQPRYHQYNQKMIEVVSAVATELDKKVIIRIHPQEKGKESSYQIDREICLFDSDSDRAEMIFGHTSTMLYTYLLKGYPTFKYLSDIKSNEISEKLVFRNEIDLQKKMNNINGVSFFEEGKKQISCWGEESCDKYYYFFESNLHSVK